MRLYQLIGLKRRISKLPYEERNLREKYDSFLWQITSEVELMAAISGVQGIPLKDEDFAGPISRAAEQHGVNLTEPYLSNITYNHAQSIGELIENNAAKLAEKIEKTGREPDESFFGPMIKLRHELQKRLYCEESIEKLMKNDNH